MTDVKKIVDDLFSFVKTDFYYIQYFFLLIAIVGIILGIMLLAVGTFAFLSIQLGSFGYLLLILLTLLAILLLFLLIPPIYFALLQRSLIRMGYGKRLSSLFYPRGNIFELFFLTAGMFLTTLFNWLEKRILIGQLVLYSLLILSLLATPLVPSIGSVVTQTAFPFLISIAVLVFVYVNTRLSLAPSFFLSRKGLSPIASVKESYSFTKNRFWEVFMFNNCGKFLTQLLIIVVLVPILILLVLFIVSSGLETSSITAAAPMLLVSGAVVFVLCFLLYIHLSGVFLSIMNARIFDILLKSGKKKAAEKKGPARKK
jgi:hypothetical protein